MPYPLFDRSRLHIQPLSARKHDLDRTTLLSLDAPLPQFEHAALPILGRWLVEARKSGSARILFMGAHVIREGVARFLIDMMDRGLLSHIAMNGAGPIHDWEFALIGATTESVARYIQTGEFGLWEETGRMNDIINAGAAAGLGLGEAIGRAILDGPFPFKDISVLAAGARLGVPITVHVGIGHDILHEHPNCDGAALGKTSYQDFLTLTESVRGLEGGVLLNVGSAVMGPEVYLKALAMARNVARQAGHEIRRFTTAVFDLHALEENTRREAPKSDPRYYYRPWKTILSRSVADGGESFYIRGDHRVTIPALHRAAIQAERTVPEEAPTFLTESRLQSILQRLPTLTVGVIGDLFLDRYLEIDGSLTELSLETLKDAYQVVHVRPSPGAAGTIINNLAAFGVKRICVVSVIGDDAEGYELRRVLRDRPTLDTTWLYIDQTRRTPTYTKPMVHEPGKTGYELNRLDIQNRTPLPEETEAKVLAGLDQVFAQVDALLVLDQVSTPNCGVITERVRGRLAELGDNNPKKLIVADSRRHLGFFRSVAVKPNLDECRRALADAASGGTADQCVAALAAQVQRPVYCTRGDQGILLADPQDSPVKVVQIPAYPFHGPIDAVGAGDSASAAIACAIAAGASQTEAAAFGCLIASVTIQQIGTTGTASPAQIRERWHEVAAVSRAT
jgi:rfaE bifunctional protein kinase chain/domain